MSSLPNNTFATKRKRYSRSKAISLSVEDAKRTFGVVVEGLRSDFRLFAESQSLLRADVDKLSARVDGIDRKVDGLTEIVQLTYSKLTGRVNDHETRIDVLERRQP